MSSRNNDPAYETPHPRDAVDLFGHQEAEAALLDAYRSGRMAHAWVIGGPKGIGKATLAYRMARFVLAHGEPSLPAVQRATSLAIDAEHPVARQVAAGSHGGLLTLERTVNDKGVLRSVITVDETRETVSFFGSTSSAGGWRVCIVDTVDELNPNAANALLKILEEPPARSLFLLVSHNPARLLPTILSRCRKLMLRPLATEDVISAAASALPAEDVDMFTDAAALSDGSVSRAIALLGGGALKLQERTSQLLAKLPSVDARELHALGDAIAGTDRATLAAFTDGVDRWITERIGAESLAGQADLARLARLAEVWDKINHAARDTADYNLERKPLVFSAFGMLADATR